MRIITTNDFIDTYCKIVQRGKSFFFSKFTFNSQKRTKSAFDNTAQTSSNWWVIPKVKQRWNYLITGNSSKNYQQYLVENHLSKKNNLKVLSLGSGTCTSELELAKYKDVFSEIICVDIAENLLKIAEQKTKNKNLAKLTFICKSIYDFDFKENQFDIILFHSSLHHFKNVEILLKEKIKKSLKQEGLLVINEFVGANRLQFSNNQLSQINRAIKMIPKKYRIRYRTNLIKSKYSGAGLLRMIVADPSECIDSKNIIPSVHKQFEIIDERPFGGNILMSALRDISHHFIETDSEKDRILDNLFSFEDEYLKGNPSDFIFGVYKNKK